MKFPQNKKLLILVILLLLAVLLLGTIFIVLKGLGGTPLGMRQVKSYNPNGICLSADNPECGYCPNKPVDNKCYVKHGELLQYQ